ncbi:MAG: hypothetical protein IPN46_18055 [Saprospiraceae bacterium]|nr:hypothetical protein [Saprospiraceae bacterium]
MSRKLFVCPMGQKLEHLGKGKEKVRMALYLKSTIIKLGGEGCPLRENKCAIKSAGNKKIEINHKL